MINFEDFEKVDLRIGKILTAEKVEESEKLVKMEVDFGEEKRQVIAGIGKAYYSEELIGKRAVFVVNLEPRIMMGLESQAMILAVKDIDNMSILIPEKEILPGSKIS
ncbi:MAG: methionine--tRNA ligase subunit beta [Candidatus Pacebacteria bacterium]|nr:methionine--tRNA ligase subunit beta [Candidatus Paceibacterota bacterium]